MWYCRPSIASQLKPPISSVVHGFEPRASRNSGRLSMETLHLCHARMYPYPLLHRPRIRAMQCNLDSRRSLLPCFCPHCFRPSLLPIPNVRLLNPQPFHQLSPQVLPKSQHPIPCDHAIRPTRLIMPMSIHKLPIAIDLNTPKDVLGFRYPPEIRRVSPVRDMHPSTSPSGAHATLITCATTRRAGLCATSHAAESGAGGGSHGCGLGLHVWVFVCVFGDDGLEDGGEVRVFAERVWGGREFGGCA